MRALVLSGGGCKGAYQVGALQAIMAEPDRDYEILCGVSVGALNAATLAQFKIGDHREAFETLARFWTELTPSKVWKRRFLGNVLSAFFSKSIYDASPLVQLVRDSIDPERVKASGKRVCVGAVALSDGEYQTADGFNPRFIDWVLASSAFPAFFEPREIGGRMWSDGGIRNVTPLGEAIRLGATEIDVVLCSNSKNRSAWPTKGRRAYEIALRAIDIMGDEITRTDLQVAGLKNDIAERGARIGKSKSEWFNPRAISVPIRSTSPRARSGA